MHHKLGCTTEVGVCDANLLYQTVGQIKADGESRRQTPTKERLGLFQEAKPIASCAGSSGANRAK